VSQPQPRRGPLIARCALRFGEACAIHSRSRATHPPFPGGFSAPLLFSLDVNEPDRVLVNGEIDSNYGGFLAHHNSGLVG
jgi:hypothetical protein